MQKNFVCLICGENVSLQIDLNKLTVSTDCKNRHHFREINFNDYYKFLPNSNLKEHNKTDRYVFYCYICQKNINLSNIKEHNGHDGIKLSLDEFLSKGDCIEFNNNILKNNFDKEINKIEKIIKDFIEWKDIFDKKFNNLIKFFEQLLILEKSIFNGILAKNPETENFYDYELLINIKEIYRINNDIHNFRKNYEGLFNNINFNKLSYFLINKIKDINKFNDISIKDKNIYYKDNKCFFNEEIKYKKERKGNLFPYIKNLFKDCKHLVGYDIKYFNENFDNKDNIKLNNKIFQNFLNKIKREYPKINHLSQMRDKSYFLVSIEKKVIIIKTNLFDIQNENDFKMKDIKALNCFFYDDLTDILFSIELTNRLLLSFSEKFFYIWESFKNEEQEEEDFYKNYFLQKKIKLKKPYDEIMQISPNLFCIYSFILMEIHFYNIENMEIITKFGGIEGTPGPVGSKYMTMIKKNLLLFAGAEKIFIISIIDMDVKAEIRTTGLVSTFCLLPNNGLLCGEINFDYNPNSPWKNNKYNLVQYQISDNEIKKISEKCDAHSDIIRSLFYFENNIILSCSTKDELKLWY